VEHYSEGMFFCSHHVVSDYNKSARPLKAIPCSARVVGPTCRGIVLFDIFQKETSANSSKRTLETGDLEGMILVEPFYFAG
jgi:hypothetical protein